MLYLGRLQPFSQTCAWLERLASDKHTSLLRTFVNYGRKFFITLDSGDKKFTILNLFIGLYPIKLVWVQLREAGLAKLLSQTLVAQKTHINNAYKWGHTLSCS